MDFVILALAKKYTDEQTFAIKSEHVFPDLAARDSYFTANPAEKTPGRYISVGSGFQRWDGIWTNITAIVKGVKGNDGAAGKSAYEIWLEAGNTGSVDDFLSSITAIDTYVAGVGGVHAGQVVIITVAHTVQAANSSNTTHAGRVIGIASATVAAGGSVKVKKAGSITCAAWNLAPGSMYYLGAGGDVIAAPPTTGFIQKIGVAETPTKLVLQIEPAILLNN